jgi:hypothetical protein
MQCDTGTNEGGELASRFHVAAWCCVDTVVGARVQYLNGRISVRMSLISQLGRSASACIASDCAAKWGNISRGVGNSISLRRRFEAASSIASKIGPKYFQFSACCFIDRNSEFQQRQVYPLRLAEVIRPVRHQNLLRSPNLPLTA